MTSVSLSTIVSIKNPNRDADQTASLLPLTVGPYRVVVGFVLASLIWKSYAYPSLFNAYLECQLSDSFFPSWFRNAYALAGLMIVPAVAALLSLLTSKKRTLQILASTMAACMLGLCLHQGSYNDATFVTCFWVSLWCVWYTTRIDSPRALAHGQTFAIAIISMIFLGGVVGKLTPGYWSGQMLYEIYFVDRDFWLFNILRSNFETETLREIATYYSRIVIITEASCALLWLLPKKVAASAALSVLLGLTLFSNVNLFSVTFCLIGLCLFVLHEPAATGHSQHPDANPFGSEPKGLKEGPHETAAA
ncbi:MAG: hypothetical protein ACI87E_001575 [Mariniblastus sp.]|jgi:hypothetical protein